MKILLTGGTGLVGTELVSALKRDGHQVTHLVRTPKRLEEPQILWNMERGQLDASALEGFDAVIHLAGEPIAGCWNDEKKAKIYRSRVKGTQLLAETLAKLEHPPKVLICASAVGYYGDRGNELLTEVSAPGKNYLAKVCRDWESAADPARAKGIRVVNLRLGVVLSPKGGALKVMYWPFRLGLAGNLSLQGKQYMPWITLEDVVGVIRHALTHESVRGPVNTVAPQETTNAQFTDAMRKALIPAFLPMHYWTPPVPAPLLRATPGIGEMAGELLLASMRVKPVVLEETGYTFKHPTIGPALRQIV